MSKKKNNEITIRSSAAEYLTYVASVGGEDRGMEIRYEYENIWLTQKMMAVLYDVTTSTINEHIKKIYEDEPKLKDVIEFKGPIFDRDKLMQEFSKAKIFCLTSRYESFGLVLSEAGSRGCYLISSNIPPARDLTDNQKYGALFEIDDSNELAEKLAEVCQNEIIIKENCEKIQNFINANYSWKNVCKMALKYLGEEVKNEA